MTVDLTKLWGIVIFVHKYFTR